MYIYIYRKAGPSDPEAGHSISAAGVSASTSQVIRLRADLGRDTREEDVEGSPTQSRISPSIQRIMRLKTDANS